MATEAGNGRGARSGTLLLHRRRPVERAYSMSLKGRGWRAPVAAVGLEIAHPVVEVRTWKACGEMAREVVGRQSSLGNGSRDEFMPRSCLNGGKRIDEW